MGFTNNGPVMITVTLPVILKIIAIWIHEVNSLKLVRFRYGTR